MIHSNDDQPAGQLCILLADDNLIEQKIAARMFQDLGYEIDVVSNGFEVVQAVRFKQYDVILIDEEMPAMNALEAASRIRKLPALGNHPWIISLAMDSNQVFTTQYREAGLNDMISKPLKEDLLWEALARVPKPAGSSGPEGL